MEIDGAEIDGVALNAGDDRAARDQAGDRAARDQADDRAARDQADDGACDPGAGASDPGSAGACDPSSAGACDPVSAGRDAFVVVSSTADAADTKNSVAMLRVECAVTRHKDTFETLIVFGGTMIAGWLLTTPAQWDKLAIGAAGGLMMLRHRCQRASDSVIAALRRFPTNCGLVDDDATRFGAAPLTAVACVLELTAYPLLLCSQLFGTSLLAKAWLSCAGAALAAAPWAFRYCCKARGVDLKTTSARRLAWARALASELLTLGTVTGLMAAKTFGLELLA